jgi:fructokinase
MSSSPLFGLRYPKPACMGTGLVALDVLVDGKQSKTPLSAGGTTANVMTILSYLGWNSHPVSSIGSDQAADLILEDMRRWSVDTNFVIKEARVSTPIIIERLVNANGNSSHWFEFKCPNCLTAFPRYRPVGREWPSEKKAKIPDAQVFFFDRVSRFSLALGKLLKERGALIVFEPARWRKGSLFEECIEVSDIVKYSYEQLEDSKVGSNASLLVQTLGAEGLRYKFGPSGERKWKKIQSFHVQELIDSAGAGDWCTAGMIHLLGQNGIKGFHRATRTEIEGALKFGQALAALNCRYEGARGLMYKLSRKEMMRQVTELYDGSWVQEGPSNIMPPAARKLLHDVCPQCLLKSPNKVTLIE